MRFRKLLQVLALGPVLALGLVPDAGAQIMKRDGFTVDWFASPADKRAREACANKQPDCRPGIKAQMDQEKAISLLIPWALAGAAVLGVLFYLRKLERQKMQKRREAQRRHDPKAYKKLDQTKEDRDRAAAEKKAAEDDDY